MKDFDKILAELDVEIDKIDLYDYDIIETSLSMVLRLQDVLTDLRNQLQTYVFSSKEEEIFFFKNQKPELLGRLLYFHKIYRIETQCPTGSNEVIRLYINKELDSLTYFFNRNLDFYQYYRSHSTIHDEHYFLRGRTDIPYVPTVRNSTKTLTFRQVMTIRSQKYSPMRCCVFI